MYRPLETSDDYLHFARDMLVESRTNAISDRACSSQQEQFDVSSDDLTELGSEVSEDDGSEDDESEGNGLESSSG